MDWTTHVVTLHRPDGEIATFQLPRTDGYETTRVKKTSWSPTLHGLLIETTEGDDVVIELCCLDQPDPLDNRVVVYLDQCIWRRMRDAMHDPEILSAVELAAAQELIELVTHRQVLLPLSSGHHQETTHWGNDRKRYQLGLTTLRLSRGWVMRDPLVVRRQELRRGLLKSIQAEPIEAQPPVFTLEPNTAAVRQSPTKARSGFPPEAVHILQTLSYAAAMASVLLDVDPIPRTTEILGWVQTNQRFSEWLDSKSQRPGPQKRKTVDVLYLNASVERSLRKPTGQG